MNFLKFLVIIDSGTAMITGVTDLQDPYIDNNETLGIKFTCPKNIFMDYLTNNFHGVPVEIIAVLEQRKLNYI